MPRTNDPERMRQIADEAGQHVNTPGFQVWYRENSCPSAPPFHQFWSYVRQSMTYDVPGCEMCGLIFEATDRAFQTFDLNRGKADIPSDRRFLKHWRHQLANLARTQLRKPRSVALPSRDVPAKSNGRDRDLEIWVMELVDQLPSEDRLILQLRYWDALPFSELARKINRRKQFVIRRHDHLLRILEANLTGSPPWDATTGEELFRKVGTTNPGSITLLISEMRDRAGVRTPPQESAA